MYSGIAHPYPMSNKNAILTNERFVYTNYLSNAHPGTWAPCPPIPAFPLGDLESTVTLFERTTKCFIFFKLLNTLPSWV